MKRLATLAALVVVAGAVLFAGSVSAIRFGESDANRHPYVGLVGFYDAGWNWMWRCTGTLVSPTVVLTAGHCAGVDETGAAPAHARIWFDQGPIVPYGPTGYPDSGGYTGTPHAHPGWDGLLTIPDTHDIGVVVLDEPLQMPEYGKLAPKGYLDDLAKRRGLKNVDFTVVGYGLQSVKPTEVGIRERMLATVSLINLRSHLTDGFNLQYSGDPGQGNGPGGTCFGDSGGPVFSGDKIVAVNSFVLNLNCQGPGFGHRTDIEQSLDFLANFGVQP